MRRCFWPATSSRLRGRIRTASGVAPPRSPSPASVILWGPPGTGKTTLAQAIAHSSGRRFVELSAVTAGVR
ncbi:AAA family ATPase, partial [Rhizobium johnstonii]|uniref:AAA family ATPase n=1 Tax=Rhizobium johnstonii TaxID=3019933 RepID=UPI003F96A6A5